MKIGVTFPQIELGRDPGAVAMFAKSVEQFGYDSIVISDHVLGVDVAAHGDWRPREGQPPIYTKNDLFHEPMVLMGYLAATTSRIGLATGVLIAPQRQTALMAKQAAEIDVLSRGRLRLVLGTGWNAFEYEGLGMNFHDRGKRIEEQIDVMRRLWTQEAVSFEGRWHKLTDVGINPMPDQRPIPIWLGGKADAVIERAARIADGWCPPSSLTETELADKIGRLRSLAATYGRPPEAVGFEGILRLKGRSLDDCVRDLDMWRRLGAGRITFNTESEVMWKRLAGERPDKAHEGFDLDARLAVLEEFKRLVDGGLST